MTNHLQIEALQILLRLASHGRAANLRRVAAELGLSCVRTDRLLARLDCAGLVDAERVRLTMVGLALAVAADFEKAARPRVPAPSARAAA
jgi:DNA-binding IclR family transcriptional regulator